MFKHDFSKKIAMAARLAAAFCTFALLGGTAAQAQTATQITTAAQLGAITFTTPDYPGPGIGQIPSPFVTAAGLAPIVLTDQNGSVFSRLDVTATSGLDYAPGTKLLQTADAVNKPLGPLQIDFGAAGVGVGGFGVTVQNFAFDTETFTLQVFTNGSTTVNPLNTFTFGPFDNSNPATNGHSVFVGALSTVGNTITRAVISSTSTVGGVNTGFANNFYFGPVTVKAAPVPEASTVVSFGMGVLLFAGLAVGARKRTARRASQSA